MTVPLITLARWYYVKTVIISIAITLLLLHSEQRFSNFPLIVLLLCGGYFLGKITCSVHLKNASISITLLVFALMNLIHSFLDGLSFLNQSLFYWMSAVGGHELIRQPTLYIILWAIIEPASINAFLKTVMAIVLVTGIWFLGIWLGKISTASFSHFTFIGNWIGYSIFLFTGDITHHLIDQYKMIKQKK